MKNHWVSSYNLGVKGIDEKHRCHKPTALGCVILNVEFWHGECHAWIGLDLGARGMLALEHREFKTLAGAKRWLYKAYRERAEETVRQLSEHLGA